ncbi:MAG TPA: ABC transporter permease, partial [Gammaproteobacteria bacterium]|nr:ABC transporter permease [Gammaproteobacteria bacterium]
MPLLLSIAATSILAMFLSLAAGIAHTFAVTASPSEIIVLPKGATFEGQGSLSRAAVKTIESAPMIAPGSGGHAKPASAEVVHFHDFPRPGGQDEFGATLRGADSVAAMRQFRPDFRLTRGRLFRPGHNELIVGSGIVKINPALVPGRTLPINDDTWTIVGVFHTGRSVDNFTAWADATDLHQTFTHGEPYESVRVRLRASDQLAAFQTYLDK